MRKKEIFLSISLIIRNKLIYNCVFLYFMQARNNAILAMDLVYWNSLAIVSKGSFNLT